MQIEKALERCNELIKETHSCWIGITNQVAIKALIDYTETMHKEFERLEDLLIKQQEEVEKYTHSLEKKLEKKDKYIKELCENYCPKKAELEKKDKTINEMAKMINSHDIDEDVCKQMGKSKECNDYVLFESNCINCIKEYFTNKVEKEGK